MNILISKHLRPKALEQRRAYISGDVNNIIWFHGAITGTLGIGQLYEIT